MSVNRTANKAQQAAIDARNNLITVSAGAGTGKTWTLAERFSSILADGNCDCNIENIITLTFTEKAAQEMKERIEVSLREKMNSATESELFALRNALAHFDDAYIMTIHSFASRILKESAITLGLDPDFSIISQPEKDELIEEIGRKIEELDEEILRYFDDTAILENILSKWLPQDIALLSSECEEIHSACSGTSGDFLQMCGNSTMKNVIEKVKAVSMPKIRLAYEKWSAVLIEIKDQIYSANKAKTPDYVLNFREFIENWNGKKLESDEEYINFFINLMVSPLKRASFGKMSEQINSCLGETAKEWKDRHKDLLILSKNLSINEIISNYPDDVREREILIKLCSVCWKMLEERRRENKTLTFSDLIKFGLEIVSSHNLNRSFKQIMIDEFQDTDPLQEKILRALAENQPNVSVFVVGDPKQSIYRFRNADLSIFESYVVESKKSGNDLSGIYIEMNNSFRMRSDLYSKINSLFHHIWPENLGESINNLKYEDLYGNADEERDAGTLPIMSILTEKHEKKSTKKEFENDHENEDENDHENEDENDTTTSAVNENAETGGIDEARKKLLAKLTETLIRWKTAGLTVWDSNEKRIRPFEWRDCAILTQTRASWSLMEEAFSKAGIPLCIQGNVSWFAHGEVIDIINMLRAIAFPDDELSNMGWHGSFLSPRDIDEEEFIRRTGKLLGGAAVLNYFLNNLYWLENIPALQRLRAYANMRYASQLAESYEKLICRSIHGCSNWLLKALNSKSRFEEPKITDDGKSVKLLTIHASKGLEFPFVIIWGIEHPPENRKTNSSLTASKHLGLFASKHALFKMFHNAIEEQAEAEEHERLLYVATTRAKDSVLYCGITDMDGNAADRSWLQYLLDWNAYSEELVTADYVNQKIVSSLFTENSPAYQIDVPGNALINNIKLHLPENKVSLARISATSYALFEWCPYAWRRKYRQGKELDFENFDGAENDSLSGKDIGSICHWILAGWNFKAEGLDNYFGNERIIENVIRLLPPYLRASYRVRGNREKIRRWLLDFADSKIGEQFRNLYGEGRLKREVPFKVSINKGIELNGCFDVFWEDENGVHLRDWKTNPYDNVLALYKNQLIFYSFALYRLKGNLSTVGIISVKDSELHDIAIKESFETIEERIVKAAKTAATGEWERKAENCLICPWKGCS